MLNIDDWRVMYEGQEKDVAKLRTYMEARDKELTLSLKIAENEREKLRFDLAATLSHFDDIIRELDELKLSLEVAQRERDTAEQMLRDCRARCERMKTMEGLSIDECAARQLWAEQSRDAALAQAAGLRKALQYAKGQFDSHAGEDYASSVCAAALAHPGPSLGVAKKIAEADAAIAGADALDEVEALRARVGELAGERDMWRIRCESPEATPVRV